MTGSRAYAVNPRPRSSRESSFSSFWIKINKILNHQTFQELMTIGAFISFIMMLVYGYDSTFHWWASMIMGSTISKGAGLHWISITMYCLAGLAISVYMAGEFTFFEDVIHKKLTIRTDWAVKNAQNFAYSFLCVVCAGIVFEFPYAIMLDYFHTNWQVMSYKFMGIPIIMVRNTLWALAGLLAYLMPLFTIEKYFKTAKFISFRFDKWFMLGVVAATISTIFWVFYPLPHLGPSVIFPQTIYPTYINGILIGDVWYSDFGIRTTNVIVKLIYTFTIIYSLMVKMEPYSRGEE